MLPRSLGGVIDPNSRVYGVQGVRKMSICIPVYAANINCAKQIDLAVKSLKSRCVISIGSQMALFDLLIEVWVG